MPGGGHFLSNSLVKFLGGEQVGSEPVALNCLVDAYEGSGADLEPVLVAVPDVLVGAVNVQSPEKIPLVLVQADVLSYGPFEFWYGTVGWGDGFSLQHHLPVVGRSQGGDFPEIVEGVRRRQVSWRCIG